MEEKKSIEKVLIPEPEKKEEDELKAEKIHSGIVQWLSDTSEYFLEDIPKSKKEIVELIKTANQDQGIHEDLPSDNVINRLYPLFLEDYERERKNEAGFDDDEDWPDPKKWPSNVKIEDPYPDFETWEKTEIEKISGESKKESAEQPMQLHEFLDLLKQEIITELSKIDNIGLTDVQKRSLGIKKVIGGIDTGVSGITISRGVDFGSMPFVKPEIKIEKDDISENKDGLQKLEKFLNCKLKFTYFDDFWERAESLDEELYKKIKEIYSQTEFQPIDLPGIRENWVRIKEYNDKKRKETEEQLKNYISPAEAERLRKLEKKAEKERYAKNKEELIQKILKKKEEK